MTSGNWCILRTSPGRTLALAASLTAAGFCAWTPRQTTMRPKPYAPVRIDGTKAKVEVDMPILPTIVFVQAHRLPEIVALASALDSPHPRFSIFVHAGRTPLIKDEHLTGLRKEEQDKAELIAIMRECETREEARRLRMQAAKNARERRKALRAQRGELAVGDRVSVRDAPAFVGMVGVVESTAPGGGTITFGGQFPMKVETWQVIRHGVMTADIAA